MSCARPSCSSIIHCWCVTGEFSIFCRPRMRPSATPPPWSSQRPGHLLMPGMIKHHTRAALSLLRGRSSRDAGARSAFVSA